MRAPVSALDDFGIVGVSVPDDLPGVASVVMDPSWLELEGLGDLDLARVRRRGRRP